MKKKSPPVYMWAAVIGVVGVAYAGYESQNRTAFDPAAYKPLLHLIARAESDGNYNAYFGNASNNSIKFTSMTIAEVQDWQKEFINEGSASSAVGRYQIIDTTLDGLVKEMKLDTSEKFDPVMQDRMAVTLLERRGARDYVRDRLTPEQFAANLAMEWAALPKVVGDNPEESYYASDGLNRSHIKTSEILATIKSINTK